MVKNDFLSHAQLLKGLYCHFTPTVPLANAREL